MNKEEVPSVNPKLDAMCEMLKTIHDLKERNKVLEVQIEKMKCLENGIIQALKESYDYEWLPAHNGKAKYIYLQTVIDIIAEKFEEIKENG